MNILTAYLSRLFPRLTPAGPASGNMSMICAANT